MERIETFEQYRQLVAGAKKLPHVCSNCYLLPGAIREMTGAGALYAEQTASGLLLLEREPTFFRCYYYLTPDIPGERLRLPLPVVAELVFNRELTAAQRTQAACLEQMGFSLGRESGRMHLADAAAAADGPAEGVERAVEADLDPVREMILGAFDPLYSYISTREEMLENIRDGGVFVIREGGAIAAVLYAELTEASATIRQVVVDGALRRRGYGQRLVCFYHRSYKDRVRSFVHWVDMANDKAIGLYQKFGYSFDGRYANEYIIL